MPLPIQRAALHVREYGKSYSGGVASFIEEMVVRRELADNYCHYNENYDSLQANPSPSSILSVVELGFHEGICRAPHSGPKTRWQRMPTTPENTSTRRRIFLLPLFEVEQSRRTLPEHLSFVLVSDALFLTFPCVGTIGKRRDS